MSVEGADAVGKPGVDHARTELVVGPARNQAGEYDAAVDIAVDQVTIGRADRHAGVHRNSALRVATFGPVKLLVEHRVEA
jgi:hypothetical protein